MKFTKKPVTIDAVQWNKDGDHPNVVELPKKVRDTIDERTTALGVDALRWIGTLEGGHIVCKGDWIITGVQGEQYPCKPDIFALTYDAAPIPPTPSQQEALDAKRWRYYADCPQTALMLGTELDPNSEQDWAAECSRLVDASLARPDTEGSGK